MLAANSKPDLVAKPARSSRTGCVSSRNVLMGLMGPHFPAAFPRCCCLSLPLPSSAADAAQFLAEAVPSNDSVTKR